MNTPVLTDLAGRDFTEGDFVVYSSTNGIRYGKVDAIKELPKSIYWRQGDEEPFKVFINLDLHRNLPANSPGKMFAKRVGYEYHPQHFLAVPELT